MKQIIDQMLEQYELQTFMDKKNAVKEVMQELVLCGLSRAKFFDKAAFYGETALRIFYGLDRFSEDLDFSLMVSDEKFTLNDYLPMLEKEISAMGLNVIVEEKSKTKETQIKSAFLKGNTKEQMLFFYSDNELIKGINSHELIKVKLEVDVNPPENATFEHKYKLLPMPYEVNLYDKSTLFAGKLHAVICRSWQNRIKGRDLYDYVFYMQKAVPFNIKHLEARLVQSGFIDKDKQITLEDVKNMLNERFESIDFNQAKEDVKPFIKNPAMLDLWSAKFFKSITTNIKDIKIKENKWDNIILNHY